MPFATLYVETAFDFLSGIVALLVSFYAFRYTKIIENTALRFLGVGFTVLGAGLLAESLIEALSFLITSTGNFIFFHRLVAVESAATYSFLQVLAYFVIFLGYLLARRKPKLSSTPGPELPGGEATASAFMIPFVIVVSHTSKYLELIELSRRVIIVASALSMAFLVAIVYLDVVGYLAHRNKQALFILGGFLLILVAQLLSFLAGIFISGTLDFASTAVQFAGFVALLLFLIWRGKIGSTRKATQ